jgi:aminomethyltransferase
MSVPTVFHSRTARLCTSLRWKDWAGYFAVCSYGTCHEPEYFAIRHSAGLIDVSPLFKYEVRGPDAAAFLSRVTVKNLAKLKVGRVTYLCWCDDDGKVVDDGTASRLDEDWFRLTSAEPAYSWLSRFSRGYDVTIEDSTVRLGTLALQGPTSRDILKQITDTDMDAVKFFGNVRCSLDGSDVWITRTGYTGDLGYEIWVAREDAETVYDALMRTGGAYGMLPAGMDALDVSRVEAGFIMNGVDYFSANHCLTEDRKSSPFELGLGWTVQLKNPRPFIGRDALCREKNDGPKRSLVGLDISWEETEKIFAGYGLPPELPQSAWRDGKPVYDLYNRWIGQATSGAWSPTLKKNLALAQIDSASAKEGSKVKVEVTAEYRRHKVTATVVSTPFFNPPRKRAS